MKYHIKGSRQYLPSGKVVYFNFCEACSKEKVVKNFRETVIKDFICYECQELLNKINPKNKKK